jgi:1-acyl-sn-glycerol-3-phosphate acyltransferase
MAHTDNALGQLLASAPGPLEAYLRMALAAVDDVAGTVARRPARDPFELRDPHYIERTLPALRLASELYFRAHVEGLENIPPRGGVLLVGNHSGGTLIADTFVFAQAFYDHFGTDRVFHQLAHDLVFKAVGPRVMVQRYGTVPASPQNMAEALRRHAALLVYPGGDHETYRPTWESAKVDFADRKGFVELALEHEVPIVPVVSIGGQETALFLGQGRRVARALRLDRLMRLNVFPAALGPPFGVTILDLPLRVPLPAKIDIRVLEPIDLRQQLGGNGSPDDGYELVTTTMQHTLTDLDRQRSLPLLG